MTLWIRRRGIMANWRAVAAETISSDGQQWQWCWSNWWLQDDVDGGLFCRVTEMFLALKGCCDVCHSTVIN
jgi:hypothetical protein